jgi:hypothetical protein
MKISLDKKQIVTVSLLFSFSFLLGFSVFGGFAKVYRHSLAKDVENFNQAQEVQQATLQKTESDDSKQVDTKPLEATLLNEDLDIIEKEEVLDSKQNEALSSVEAEAIDGNKEEKIKDLPLNNKENNPFQEDPLNIEDVISIIEEETDPSQEIEILDTKPQDPLSTIDQAFLGEK